MNSGYEDTVVSGHTRAEASAGLLHNSCSSALLPPVTVSGQHGGVQREGAARNPLKALLSCWQAGAGQHLTPRGEGTGTGVLGKKGGGRADRPSHHPRKHEEGPQKDRSTPQSQNTTQTDTSRADSTTHTESAAQHITVQQQQQHTYPSCSPAPTHNTYRRPSHSTACPVTCSTQQTSELHSDSPKSLPRAQHTTPDSYYSLNTQTRHEPSVKLTV